MTSLFIFATIVASAFGATPVSDVATDKLIFVQAVWRHGDRSPTTTFPRDIYQEDYWPQGWGQLSALGMQQHVDLGETLRGRYVYSLKFLNEVYKNHEIYVRSTDVNRTLISAMSNMIGMYPNGNQDQIPQIPQWPRNKNGDYWLPIAVHTINDDLDYTLNPDRVCPYQDELWSSVEKSQQYLDLQNSESEFFDFLTNQTGMTVTPTTLWIIADALFIEQSNSIALPKWTSELYNGTTTYYDRLVEINNVVEKWNNGLGLDKINGLDMSIEIPKIRGGTLLWSIIGHLQQKWQCYLDSGAPNCVFFNKLKYYAYSAHDTTIASLFSTFGFSRTNYNEDGYPHYSSCVTIELWQNVTSLQNYVKILYFPLDKYQGHNIVEDITEDITGGPISDIDSFAARSEPYKPSESVCTNTKSNAPKLVQSMSIFIFILSFFTMRNL